jgi:hypothetical protein
LDYPGSGETMRCPYCNNSVIVPSDLRPAAAGLNQTVQPSPSFTPNPTQVQAGGSIPSGQIAVMKQLVQAGKKIEAIKMYRQITGVGLKEAKDAVEAMAGGADMDAYQKNNPVGAQKKNLGDTIRAKLIASLVGLFFLGLASIFPIVFFPMGMDAWQNHDIGGALGSFIGAGVWALAWGGIGIVVFFGFVFA